MDTLLPELHSIESFNHVCQGARVSAFKGALHELIDLQAAEGQFIHHTPSVTIMFQGRRKVPRSGAAVYRGRAAVENLFPRSVEKIFDLFFNFEETALVVSRYIEGHALTLCIYTVTV